VLAWLSRYFSCQCLSSNEKSKAKSRRIIEDTDISEMFGIEMETKVKKKRVKKGRV